MGKSKPKSSTKRKTKINLVFNEDNRREFLTGFHKRKLQRKKDAKAQLEKQLLEEKKRLKAEAKESYKKLVKSYTAVPEVEHLLAEEYEDDDVNVKVIELSTSEIAKQNNWLGSNQPHTTEISDKSVEESVSGDEVPGMQLKSSNQPKAQSKNNPTNKTKAQIKHMLKKQATKNVQKSKPFQMKNKMERQKQKKKSDRMKKIRTKLQNKKHGSRGQQF